MMWTSLGFFINITKTGKKSNPKMTDTFDIQMNNTSRTNFAHQCRIHLCPPMQKSPYIIMCNNNFFKFKTSMLGLFSFLGNSKNG